MVKVVQSVIDVKFGYKKTAKQFQVSQATLKICEKEEGESHVDSR